MFGGSVLAKAMECLYSLLLFVGGFIISENWKSRPWSSHNYYLSELNHSPWLDWFLGWL